MNMKKFQKLFGVAPLGFTSGMILFGLLWLLDRALDHAAIMNDPWVPRLIGLILIVLWICWHTWCLRTIRTWWKFDQLCTKGPYRFVRHPIYSGVLWGCGIGFALLFNSWILLPGPFLCYPLWSVLVRKEEKMMETVFGETYKQYASRTGKLFPKLFI
jgi:protein-S-isoprenylcysteine O-methyltransferase Ste14